MKTRVQELIQIGDAEFSRRFKLLTLWQTYAENFYPMRADFTRDTRSISEEFASFLMTSRPVLAYRELASAIGTILRPRNMEWFQPYTGDERIDEDRGCKAFYEYSAKVMRRVMYRPGSSFVRATNEGDKDYILIGQCVIEPRVSRDRLDLMYRTWHPRDCIWFENSELQIDQVHRKWQPDRRQLLQAFKGVKTPYGVHPTLKTAAEKDPQAKVKCRRIVLPAEDYDSFGTDPNGNKVKRGAHKFVSIDIDEENEYIMEEMAVPELGYLIPRWATIGGFSQYAYSPSAMVALPDARMLQQIYLTLIEIGQKIVDPPMISVGDAIQGGVNLQSGAINWVDPDYDERTGEVLRPIAVSGQGLAWNTEFMERIEKVVSEAFHLNDLNLPPADGGDKMTAFEVAERMKEYIRRATPLFEPMDVEYNGKLCASMFRELDRIGAFGSMMDRPPLLRGRTIDFKFTNPLVQADDQRKLTSFNQVAQLLATAMQIDPAVRADFDNDAGFRGAYPGTGAPAKWLVDPRKAEAVKTEARQQQAAAQQAADLGHVGEQAGKMGIAAKNVGDAAQSMQQAGMIQ